MSIISNSVLGKCSKCGMDVSLNTLATHSCEALKLAQEQIEQLKKELDESLMKAANDRLDIEFPLVQEVQRLKEKNKKLVEALEDAVEALANAHDYLIDCQENEWLPTHDEVNQTKSSLEIAKKALEENEK